MDSSACGFKSCSTAVFAFPNALLKSQDAGNRYTQYVLQKHNAQRQGNPWHCIVMEVMSKLFSTQVAKLDFNLCAYIY